MTKIGILNASLELLFVLLILMLFPIRGVLVCKLAIVYIVVQFALGRYRDKSLLLGMKYVFLYYRIRFSL